MTVAVVGAAVRLAVMPAVIPAVVPAVVAPVVIGTADVVSGTCVISKTDRQNNNNNFYLYN